MSVTIASTTSGLLRVGLALAGVIVGFLTWLHQRHSTDPTVVNLRYGILPVIVD